MLFRNLKYLFILFTFCACAQKIAPEGNGSMLSQEALIAIAINKLEIDASKIGFVESKISPSNSTETIVVISEIVNEDEGASESNSHIAIVTNSTGKVTHSFFESAQTNGWESNAIFISDITIDTLNYTLNKTENAFGVKVHFRSMSQPNPYSYTMLSLFKKDGNRLKKVLHFYPVSEDSGVVNVNACDASFSTRVNTLSMSDEETNGNYDISIHQTVSKSVYAEDENGDCNPNEMIISSEETTLKFNTEVYEENKAVTIATIDSVSLQQIKRYVDKEYPTIFDYYALEKIDNVAIWSDKLFGRCCSEADLDYSELLTFEITANQDDRKHPYHNLSDKYYTTAFAFKAQEYTEINLKLKRDEASHSYHTNLAIDAVLKQNDTILKPFKLSLVNGNVTSEKTFRENARVKELQVLWNNIYIRTIKLVDTPLVQEFQLDFIFTKNDVVSLVPVSYYEGALYDDVYLSEIQSSLAHITHASINAKYKIRELWNSAIKLKEDKK